MEAGRRLSRGMCSVRFWGCSQDLLRIQPRHRQRVLRVRRGRLQLPLIPHILPMGVRSIKLRYPVHPVPSPSSMVMASTATNRLFPHSRHAPRLPYPHLPALRYLTHPKSTARAIDNLSANAPLSHSTCRSILSKPRPRRHVSHHNSNIVGI